jgi:16S rRNA (guanine966-N2)-methyltransferase
VRVIAGAAKRVRLAPVPAGTRPVSDRAREGLFSSLGPTLEGLRVLDLFAGTGAMGIEALSRGALHATFVDDAPAAIRAIEENLRRTKLEKSATVRRTDAIRAVRSNPGLFELVFADPPYAIPGPDLDRLLAESAGQGVVSAGGRFVLTRRKQSYTPVIPVHWRLDRRLSYGDTTVLVLVAQ